jgi:mannose-6-phosphate isomerase-like protein (cupin superfamily)
MYTKFSKGSYGNLQKMTIENDNYRQVIDTTPTQQLVLMSLEPNMEIGQEVHPYNTQFIRIEQGSCQAMIHDTYINLEEEDFIIIPPNTLHNIMNKDKPLKLYTIYSPPHHPYDKLEKTKNDKINEI